MTNTATTKTYYFVLAIKNNVAKPILDTSGNIRFFDNIDGAQSYINAFSYDSYKIYRFEDYFLTG